MSRAARDGKAKFQGLAYDPYTHQAQGAATAEVETDDEEGLSGVLQLPGLRVPIGQDEPLEPIHTGRRATYETKKDGNSFKKDGKPLKITIQDYGFSLFVDVTRPHIKYGRLNVTLPAKERGRTAEDVRGMLIGNGNGNPDRPTKEMPASGIPPAIRPSVPDNGGDK